MSNYDAEIRVNTAINNKKFINDAEKIEHSLSDIEKGIETAETKMKSLEALGVPKTSQLYRSAAKDLARWNAELKAVKGSQKKSTEEFTGHLNLMRVDVEEFANTLKELEKQGKYFGDEDYDRVYLAWKNAVNEVKKYQSELNNNTQKVKAEEQHLANIKANATVTDQRTVELLERRKQILIEIRELERAGVTAGYREYDSRKAELKGINKQLSSNGDIGGTIAQITALAGKVSKVVAIVIAAVTAVKKFGTALKKVASGIIRILGGIVRKFTGTVKLLTSLAGKMFSGLTSGFKKSERSAGGFTDRLFGLVKSVFVFNVISKAFQDMVTGVQDSTKKFTHYSVEFNEDISSLVNSLGTLKNAIAGAFAPLISVAIPYLVQLINYATIAVSAVSRLVAALTGKSTWSRAKKQNQNYAESLDNIAGSAKKAMGALARFDDLDVLQKQDTSSGGNGSGGDLWEEVPVDEETRKFADWLKEILLSDDWTDLGSKLAGKLTEMLLGIPWADIKAAARKIGHRIGTLLDGFLGDPTMWNALGYTVGQGLNTLLYFVLPLLDSIGFEQIGSNIASAINTGVEIFSWELLAAAVITGINDIVNLLYGFIRDIDLALIGEELGAALFAICAGLDYDTAAESVVLGLHKINQGISSFISETDFEELALKLANAINHVIQGLVIDGDSVHTIWSENGKVVGQAISGFFQYTSTLFGEIEWKTLGRNISTWFENAINSIDWEAAGESFENLANGFLDAILTFLEETDWDSVGTKIGEMFETVDWESLKDKLKEVLQELINSAIEVLPDDFVKSASNVGESIIKGFLVGIITGGNLLTAVFRGLFYGLVALVMEMLGIHSPSTVFQEIGWYLIEGLLLGIQETWLLLQEWFATAMDELQTSLDEKWTDIKESISEKLTLLEDKAREAWTNISSTVQEKSENIKTKSKELADKFKELKESTKTAFDNMKQKISDTVSDMVGKISEFIDKIREAIATVKEFLSSGYQNAASAFSSAGYSNFATEYGLKSAAVSAVAELPHLASGAVIRGGNPFVALLGEQPPGQTNIEAPLSTIRQALREELGQSGYGRGNARIVLQINGQDVGEAIVDDLLSVMNRKGLDVEVLGVT